MHTSKYKIPTPDPPQKATNEDDFSTQNAIRRTKPTRAYIQAKNSAAGRAASERAGVLHGAGRLRGWVRPELSPVWLRLAVSTVKIPESRNMTHLADKKNKKRGGDSATYVTCFGRDIRNREVGKLAALPARRGCLFSDPSSATTSTT